MGLGHAAVCWALQELLVARPHLRCVLTGTNFFALLVVSTGSEAKIAHILMDGTFPPEWVMENLAEKYFDIPEGLRSEMFEHVTFLSGNRRAVQHFFVDLKRIVNQKPEGDELSSSELRKVRVDAHKKWSGPITRALGDGACSAALMTVAALLFPVVLGGKRELDGSITFSREELPVALRKFGLAGGLNVSLAEDGMVSLSVPRGCVWEYMSTFVDKKSFRSNVEETKSFVRVARSNHPDIGHAFERLLACELSMVGPEGCPLYEWLAKGWRRDGVLVPDALVFGQPFIYEGRIRDAVWRPHQVYCVAEWAKDKGERVVDLDFPVWLVNEKGEREQKRVMCELKKGYTDQALEIVLGTYFTEMQECVTKNTDVLVCFVASILFRGSKQPVKKSAKKGVSANDSWQHCHDLIDRNSRFLILDDMVSHSRFPLSEIFAAISDPSAESVDPDVTSLAEEVSYIYLGTPIKKENI